MISLNLNAPSTPESGVLALLAVVADPAATKQRLDELTAMRDDAEDKLDSLAEIAATQAKNDAEMASRLEHVVSREQALVVAAKKLQDDTDKHTYNKDVWQTERTERLKEMTARANSISEAKVALDRNTNLIVARETSIAQREARMDAREKKQAEAQKALDELAVKLRGE